MGPSYRMDPQGSQSTSLGDLDLLVQIKNIFFFTFFTFFISTIILKPKSVLFKIFKAPA